MSSEKPRLNNRPPGTVNTESWVQFWQDNWIPFHRTDVNWALEKFYDQLVSNRQPPLRALVPLCGKTVDMKWLAEKGHEVVGVEISSLAILAFFNENNIKFTQNEITGGIKYKASDPKLNVTVYQFNFFEFTKELFGKFDIIQDRGAFVALNGPEKQQYVATIRNLLTKSTRYLLNSLEYDDSIAEGPPFSNSEEKINHCYGDICDIKKMETKDAVTDGHRKVGLTYFLDSAYLLQLKS